MGAKGPDGEASGTVAKGPDGEAPGTVAKGPDGKASGTVAKGALGTVAERPDGEASGTVVKGPEGETAGNWDRRLRDGREIGGVTTELIDMSPEREILGSLACGIGIDNALCLVAGKLYELSIASDVGNLQIKANS